MSTELAVESVKRSPAAERMRLHRERKKNGMRCVMIEIRNTEIDAFIQKGFLKAEMRNDVVASAIYAWLDREFS
jgi:hypothetical protein